MEYRSRVYTDRPAYADYDSPEKIRFANGWLSREQDRPHFDKKSNVRQTTFHNLDERKDDIEDFALKKMMAELEEG